MEDEDRGGSLTLTASVSTSELPVADVSLRGTSRDTSAEDLAPCPSLWRILHSPGLRFLVGDILLRLDPVSFARAERVCTQWRALYLAEALWRRRLLGSAAPNGTYFRQLVENRCPEFLAASSVDCDPVESSRLFRRLCWRIEGQGMLREWTDKNSGGGHKSFKVSGVSNSRIVRDLKVNGARIAFATGSAVHVGRRSLVPLRSKFLSYSLHIYLVNNAFSSCSPSLDSSTCSEKDATSHRLEVDSILDGHRREVIVFDWDPSTDLLVAGGRDRKLTFWETPQDKPGRMLHHVNEAHSRLITAVRLRGGEMASSSRDHLVRFWRLEYTRPPQQQQQHGGSPTSPARSVLVVTLLHTFEEHSHSVWAVDFNADFMVSGASDNLVGIWGRTTKEEEEKQKQKKSDVPASRVEWTLRCRLEEHSSGIRQAFLLHSHPDLCVTGDIYGDLRVWDCREGRLRYAVPDQEGASWFRHSGAVASVSQSDSSYLAVAFGSHRLTLYSTARAREELQVARAIDMGALVDPSGLVRGVVATPVEIYVCVFSGKNGIVVLDMWDEEKEE